MKLLPKTVTITGSFKAFGFRDGLSSGTDASITFDIPDGMTQAEFKQELVQQKYALDVFCMRNELIRGMIPKELYNEIRDRHKKGSLELLNEYQLQGQHGSTDQGTGGSSAGQSDQSVA